VEEKCKLTPAPVSDPEEEVVTAPEKYGVCPVSENV
jgi:hypothetical protein